MGARFALRDGPSARNARWKISAMPRTRRGQQWRYIRRRSHETRWNLDDSSSVKEALLAGVRSLNPVLEPHGFVFKLETRGEGSGGWFVSGAYQRGNRRLELHFRYSLGLVTYSIGKDSMDHEHYMRLLGVYGKNQYPDFPDDPLESFRSLAMDIQTYCQDFTSGDGQEFCSLVAKFSKNPTMFKGLS